MTLKTKSLMLLLIISAFHMQAQEPLSSKTLLGKTVGSITRSKPVYLFEKYIQTGIADLTRKIMPMGLSNQPAAAKYQELGQEAQHALGIIPERHVPIKQISSTSILANFVSAIAEPDAIYVNEKKLNQQSYGVQRCAMFHEAVHKKYNDMSADTIIELVTMIAAGIAAYKLIQFVKPQEKYKILHGVCTLTAGLGFASLASVKYHQSMERRADIEGHYATQCSTCVHESAARRHALFEQENHPLKNNGYLSAADLKKIAHDLEQHNKICACHQEI